MSVSAAATISSCCSSMTAGTYRGAPQVLNAADIAFLCLPDAAAREAVSLIENDTTRVIDASTAHRTDPDWDYGFAELSKAHREAIKNSKRVANPGCHASDLFRFTSLV